jgi:hypothetical protein
MELRAAGCKLPESAARKIEAKPEARSLKPEKLEAEL